MDTHLRQAIDSAVAAVWGQGAQVSQIVPLAGDASSRSYARLHLAGNMPATAVEVERLYRRAIDQLVLLQIDGTRRRDPSCIAFQQRFDQRLFLWEFEHFIEWGLEKRAGRALAPIEGQALRTIFEQIASRLDR